MKAKRKKTPKFTNEAHEQEFWATHDSVDFVDWSKARRVLFPKLRPSMKTISLRLPVWMVAELCIQANKRDVPYQSLLKVYLADRLAEERVPYGTGRHRR